MTYSHCVVYHFAGVYLPDSYLSIDDYIMAEYGGSYLAYLSDHIKKEKPSGYQDLITSLYLAYLATWNGDVGVVKVLLENEKYPIEEVTRSAVYRLAIRKGRQTVADLLIEHGVDPKYLTPARLE